MCMEEMIAMKFRNALKTNQRVVVFEEGEDIVVVVGEKVYINVGRLDFCFVSHQDIIHFSH